MEQTSWAGPSGGGTSKPGFFPFRSPDYERGQPAPVPSLPGRVACSLVWGWGDQAGRGRGAASAS